MDDLLNMDPALDNQEPPRYLTIPAHAKYYEDPRFGLSESSKKALRFYDGYLNNHNDEGEVRRVIGDNPRARASVIEAIKRCSILMAKDQSEQQNCMVIIDKCMAIIRTCDGRPTPVGFPAFMKLPPEIRRQIYDLVILGGNRPKTLHIEPEHPCNCPHLKLYFGRPSKPKVDLSLAFVSKRLRNDILPLFYKKNTFYFSCGCQMEAHLKTNVLLGEHAQSVKFHWCGPRSDAGIMMLHNLRNLNELTVVVSKLTTVHPTRRDAIYARYFGGRPSSSARMTDALGMDELLTLRRLRIVSAEHISRRPGDRISESVRYQLHVLLREKLERPPVNGIPLGFYTWTVPTKP